MKRLMIIWALFTMTACNSIYYTPNSLDINQTFYADRGGYGMKRSIKDKMRERGYNIVVGTNATSHDVDGDMEWDSADIPDDTRYRVKVSERREKFNPFWCLFNGFWWWNFNVSIADQDTGTELMTWRGRACQNSALRMLDNILDDMEVKNAGNK